MADKLAALSSNKSVGRKVKAALERLTQDQVEDMDNDPKITVKALADSIHDFREEVGTIDKANINTWATRLEKIKEKLAVAEKRSAEAREQLDVVNWLAEQNSKDKQALKNVVGYLRRRLTKWLRVGGCGKSISKHIATDIEQGNGVGKEYKDIAKDLEVSAFDCRIVTIWTASKGLANDMVKLFKDATMDDIGKRIATLTAMLAEHFGWGGAMTRIESNLELLEEMAIFSGTTAHWGAKASTHGASRPAPCTAASELTLGLCQASAASSCPPPTRCITTCIACPSAPSCGRQPRGRADILGHTGRC